MQKIAAAFVRAKRAFGPALKDKKNPAFRSKYADLGACLEAVDAALLAEGIALVHETAESDSGVIVETVLLHESGEVLRFGKLHVPAAKQDPQGYGSALTYARRYSLMAACGIAPEDDDGNAASDAKQRQDEEKATALLDALRAAAMGGTSALKTAHAAHRKDPALASVWAAHADSLKTAAETADQKEPA